MSDTPPEDPPEDLPEPDDIPATGSPDDGQSLIQILVVVALVLFILWLVGIEVKVG